MKQSLQVAGRNQADGLPVGSRHAANARLQRCAGMSHGFLKHIGVIDGAAAAMGEANAWLRARFAAPRSRQD